ncbi:MAG: mtlA, partial [Bacillota bacterium]|nr:mtlA [Bacillota bacterium]
MSLRVKAQHFGSALSRMVIPNLGAFLAWGILTAVGVAIGNEMIKSFISPMLVYMLPILIAVAAGKMVYDYRGSVVGVVATMGVIIGSGIPMFLGAMIMAPIA